MIAAKRITYNLNGGSGSTPASSICMTNPCTLNSGNTNSFYRAGYQLVGWSTDPDAEDGSFSITVSGNTTVYAVWKACTGATYKNSSAYASAACSTCPSGYSMGGTALTSINACRMYVNDGQYLAERYSSTTKQCPAGYACLANAINYGTISEEEPTYFYQCTGATFSRAGSARCFDCPSGTSGWTRGEGVGWTDNSSCYQYRNATDISPYCASGELRQYGNRGSVGSGWSDVVMEYNLFKANPGSIVTGSDANMTCTQCDDGEYSAGGTATSCTACLDNYTTSGDALTNHDSASDCKIYCDGGSYIAVANATQCSPVGAGYWAPSSTIPQGSVGSRNACASGLTTIGSGFGADEAGDCGRVLNVGDEKIYLRSTKKTTPSLNISINGDVFYGNMSTATKGSLRINSGGTTYSVYDDSM